MSDFGYGLALPSDSGNAVAKIQFIARRLIARMNTTKLVQVQAVHSNGAVAAAGTVDVLPLVCQVDGNFNATPHGIVYGIPWYRLQGGLNAVICDPQVNDIGYVTVSDRDISGLVSSRTNAGFPFQAVNPVPPGTWRQNSLSDGIYVGGCLNATPAQYIQFTSTGIVISDQNGNSITFGPTGITVVGNLIMAGNLQLGGSIQGQSGATYGGTISTTGSVVAGSGGADQVTLQTHKHSGVTTGAGTSGAPVAGT